MRRPATALAAVALTCTALVTSAGAGPPTCFGQPATRVGTPGDDVLTGTSGPDVIVGLGGNDVLLGVDGRDRLCGGDGVDLLDGGDGRDRLRGDDDGDTLVGGRGPDRLVGGSGPDTAFAGDEPSGHAGADTIALGGGDDAVYDYLGANQISAGPGDDLVVTGAGDDVIDLGPGRNLADAGPGDDTITAERPGTFLGGAPANLMVGDLGNDTITGPGVCAASLATESYGPTSLITAVEFSSPFSGEVDVLDGCRDVTGRTVSGDALLDIYPLPFHSSVAASRR